jgi:hypothetical protein
MPAILTKSEAIMKKTVFSAITSLLLLSTQLSTAQVPVDPESREIRHVLAAAVSAERIGEDIRKLVGFGTRHTCGTALGRAGIQKHFP